MMMPMPFVFVFVYQPDIVIYSCVIKNAQNNAYNAIMLKLHSLAVLLC
jgi:hypothetical protein